MEKKWEEMSADEKQEAQFKKLLTPKDHEGNDLKFQSPEAEAAFKASITGVKDAIQSKNRTGCRYSFLPHSCSRICTA